MKIETIIDKTEEERTVIYAKERSSLISAIERLLSLPDDELQKQLEHCTDTLFSSELIGFSGSEGVRIHEDDVLCFTLEDGKLYALTQNEKLLLKYRLYQVEAMLSRDFVKINQSSVANIKGIERFDTSISGTLKVKFKNGYTDYVSRRCLKNVKERLGL